MCNPMAAYMGITALAAIQQVRSQNQLANAQEKALTDASAASDTQAQVIGHQINENTTDEISLRARQALTERAKLRVAASEAGVGGATTQRVINNAYTQKGWDVSRIESNRLKALQQNELDRQGRAAGYRSQASTIQRGSYAGAGLQIAGAYAETQLPTKE